MHRAGADARVARLRRPRRHAWPARAIGPPARVSRRMPRGDGRRPPNRARVSARCPDRARACPPGRASGLSTRRANPKWRLGSQSAGRSLWAGWWLWPFQNSTTRPSGRHDQGRRPSGTARRASTSTVLAQSLPGYPGHALPQSRTELLLRAIRTVQDRDELAKLRATSRCATARCTPPRSGS